MYLLQRKSCETHLHTATTKIPLITRRHKRQFIGIQKYFIIFFLFFLLHLTNDYIDGMAIANEHLAN